MGVITIKGHHGTDIDSCKAILKSNYKISEGDQHWLGEGVYFFIEGLSTDTINLAEKWAIAEAWDNDNKKYKYTDFDLKFRKRSTLIWSNSIQLNFNEIPKSAGRIS